MSQIIWLGTPCLLRITSDINVFDTNLLKTSYTITIHSIFFKKFKYTHVKNYLYIPKNDDIQWNIQSMWSVFAGNVWKPSLNSIIQSKVTKLFMICKSRRYVIQRWIKRFAQTEYLSEFLQHSVWFQCRVSKWFVMASKYHL